MRGICIAAVVLFHGCAQAGLAGWVRGGFIGVSVFFTLSGFLITSLLLREHSSTGRIQLDPVLGTAHSTPVAGGVRRRRARSSPSALPARSLRRRPTPSPPRGTSPTGTSSPAASAKLLQTIVGPLGPTWSLAVEEQFYVVLALLLVVVARAAAPPLD